MHLFPSDHSRGTTSRVENISIGDYQRFWPHEIYRNPQDINVFVWYIHNSATHLYLVYPSGTGSSFSILIEPCALDFFISRVSLLMGVNDLRSTSLAWSTGGSIRAADSRRPLPIREAWGLNPGGGPNIRPVGREVLLTTLINHIVIDFEIDDKIKIVICVHFHSR